ncbi:MAG: type III pantothenate kinase [Lachnospiraceae bacterium]|nr:type III pantothenate kinase [Lachnospiraceae bacterium]
MILAIDIGNTNIVIGCIDGENIVFEERLYTDLKKTELEYAISFKTVLEIYEVDSSRLQGGIISSVVPPITATVRHAAEKIINKKILEVGPGVKTGLDIKIDNPAQLGPDLAVGAVAGIAEYQTPLAVVDMGTATTITVVNEKQQVIGGMIMPGVGVSLDSLINRTSQLPKISMEAPKRFIGSNTVDCMKSGVLYGTAASLDGMIERIEEELGQPVTVVATGGMAKYIIPHCRKEIVLDDALLLKGLKRIYDRNQRDDAKKYRG